METQIRKQYRFSEYLNFLDAIKDAGIQTRCISEWGAKGLYILHDIHGKIEVCRSFAKEEARRDILSTYFLLPEAACNWKWFDTPTMWDTLSEIQASGSEIGLHIDPFDLCPRIEPGGLFNRFNPQFIRTIRSWKTFFRKNGFPMRVANLHGSTTYWECGMVASDFFRETMRPRDTILEFLKSLYWKHFGRYRLCRLPFRYIVALTMVLRHGDPKVHFPDYYISDNSKRFILHKIDPDVPREQLFLDFHANLKYLKASNQYIKIQKQMKVRTGNWTLDSAAIEKIIDGIAHKRTLALVHPQWFEGA